MTDQDDLNSGTLIPGEGVSEDNRIRDDASATQTEFGADDGSELAERARLQGWVPREEFRGPAEKWRPADEFLKRGEEIVPILKERTRTLESRLEEANRKLAIQEAESRDRFSRLERMSELALIRQREDIYSTYEAAKRSAVEMGDVARYEQLSRDQNQAIHHHDQRANAAVQPPPQQRQPAAPDARTQVIIDDYNRKVGEWETRNPWMRADEEMRAVATAYSQRLLQKTPGITLEDNLRATEAYVRQRYPEKFPGSANGGAAVESGSRIASGTNRKRGVIDLPADAKKQGEKFVSQGLFKNIAEYANDYWSQDV